MRKWGIPKKITGTKEVVQKMQIFLRRLPKILIVKCENNLTKCRIVNALRRRSRVGLGLP